MTITRYFQRTISVHTTVRPHAVELDKDTFVNRVLLFSSANQFEKHHDYTDSGYESEISVNIHSVAGESFGMLQFIVVTGEEEVVEQEAKYICHI